MTIQVSIEDASALDEVTFAWESEAAPDASPAAGPTWLRATDGIDPRIPPVRYLTARDPFGALAAMPLHVIPGPGIPDGDPRSYFGGSPDTTAGAVCCGSPEPSPAGRLMSAVNSGEVFPALLLGSMSGYKTEILSSWWPPGLAAALVDAALSYARSQHLATVIAPWVADRGSGQDLAREFGRQGAVAAYWAAEDYLPLRHHSLNDHLAAARRRDRYRYNQDMRTAGELGLDIRVLTDSELRDHADRIGVLAAATRRRHGQDSSEADVPKVIIRLLDLGVPLLCTAGFKAGTMVACCVSAEKAGRVYAKYAGFDYDVLGTRSGAHFCVVIYATLAAALERRAHIIEYGIGAHQAKALRGCQPRTVTSHLLTSSPRLRDAFAAAAVASTLQRRAEYAQPGQQSEGRASQACC